MTHGEAAHERGTHNMFTGYRPSPALVFPSMGSVVSHEYGPRNNLPPYVCIPNVPNEFAANGYLSSSFAPFSLGSDPAAGAMQQHPQVILADGKALAQIRLVAILQEEHAQQVAVLERTGLRLVLIDRHVMRALLLLGDERPLLPRAEPRPAAPAPRKEEEPLAKTIDQTATAGKLSSTALAMSRMSTRSKGVICPTSRLPLRRTPKSTTP